MAQAASMASDFTKVAAQTASDMIVRQAVSQATTAAQTAAQAAAAITPTAAPKKCQPKAGPSRRQDGSSTSQSTGCIRYQTTTKPAAKSTATKARSTKKTL